MKIVVTLDNRTDRLFTDQPEKDGRKNKTSRQISSVRIRVLTKTYQISVSGFIHNIGWFEDVPIGFTFQPMKEMSKQCVVQQVCRPVKNHAIGETRRKSRSLYSTKDPGVLWICVTHETDLTGKRKAEELGSVQRFQNQVYIKKGLLEMNYKVSGRRYIRISWDTEK